MSRQPVSFLPSRSTHPLPRDRLHPLGCGLLRWQRNPRIARSAPRAICISIRSGSVGSSCVSRSNVRVRPAAAGDIPALVTLAESAKVAGSMFPGRLSADDRNERLAAALRRDPGQRAAHGAGGVQRRRRTARSRRRARGRGRADRSDAGAAGRPPDARRRGAARRGRTGAAGGRGPAGRRARDRPRARVGDVHLARRQPLPRPARLRAGGDPAHRLDVGAAPRRSASARCPTGSPPGAGCSPAVRVARPGSLRPRVRSPARSERRPVRTRAAVGAGV